eukprot:646177-Hanusia_phi.AAC.2
MASRKSNFSPKDTNEEKKLNFRIMIPSLLIPRTAAWWSILRSGFPSMSRTLLQPKDEGIAETELSTTEKRRSNNRRLVHR